MLRTQRREGKVIYVLTINFTFVIDKLSIQIALIFKNFTVVSIILPSIVSKLYFELNIASILVNLDNWSI